MGFTRLNRYLFRAMAIATVATLVALTCVVWITSALREISLVTGKGQTFIVFLQFTLLSLPALVVVIAPVAAFIAAIHTLNKSNGDSELIVMSAAGLSPAQTIRPFLALGAAVTVLVAVMTLHIMPNSFRDLRDMITKIRADFISNVVKEGQFVNIDAGITFHYRERQGETLLGIFFQDRREEGRSTSYIAERGQTLEVEGRPFLVLEQGTIQRQEARSRDSSIVTFERYGVDLASFGQEGAVVSLKPRERTTLELFNPDPNDPQFRHQPGRFRSELHDRFIAPLYVMAFMLIAFAALGEPRTTRQGRGAAIAAAVLAVVAVRIIGFGFSTAMVRSGAAVLLAYALPLAVSAFCLLMIFGGGRMRAVKARMARFAERMIEPIRLRFARTAS
jgi:lipopolysaccharide export system permease protein